MMKVEINPFSTTASPERRIKGSADLTAGPEGQLQAFQERFGSEPGPQESIFFDPDAEDPELQSEGGQNEMWTRICDTMFSEGVDPAIVYASRKTERIVTTENLQNLTPAELAEWSDAIDEYRSQQGPVQ
jgi:hypothetical protein